MDVIIKYVVPEYPSRIHIQWDVENAKDRSLVFDVQRSGSPGGPWKTLESDLEADAYTDDLRDPGPDDEINQLTLDKEIYYRLIGRDERGHETKSDPVDNRNNTVYDVNTETGVGYRVDQERNTPNPETDLDAPREVSERVHRVDRAVLRRYFTDLRQFTGVEFYVLKRKHFGKRCSHCYEATSGVVLDADCDACYGTSWEGGYFPAIETYAKYKESAVQSGNTSRGKEGNQQAQINMLSFPRVEEDDILVEADSDDRYKVRNVRNKQIRQRTIKQKITASKLGRTNVAYDVPVDTTSIGIPHDNE